MGKQSSQSPFPKMSKLTAVDFLNAGYSKSDATRLASDSNSNWKAARGGERGKWKNIEKPRCKAGKF
jgi:hypothetical protein